MANRHENLKGTEALKFFQYSLRHGSVPSFAKFSRYLPRSLVRNSRTLGSLSINERCRFSELEDSARNKSLSGTICLRKGQLFKSIQLNESR